MAKADANGMTNAAGIAYGDLIRRQRKAKNMKQEELGALVKVGKNAVGAWEAGRSRPDVASCEALDLSLTEFFGMEDGASGGLNADEHATLVRRYSVLNGYNRQVILRQMSMLYDMQDAVIKPRKVIPLFRNELAASAGPGETLDAVRGEQVYVFADRNTEEADEIIRVNGNSMEPTYYDGDLVLVKHVSSVRPGEVGVFIVGDTGYIKEYQKDGLHSHNPAYAPIVFSEGEDVHCAGKVLGKVNDDAWADEESFTVWQEYEKKGR